MVNRLNDWMKNRLVGSRETTPDHMTIDSDGGGEREYT